MKSEASWHVELAVKPGQLDKLLALTREMVEYARNEEGVLSYQRYVSDDGSGVHIYERYADSAAAIAHLANFTETFAGRFSELVDRKRFTVYGNVSPELKSMLDGFGATSYLSPFGDLPYWS